MKAKTTQVEYPIKAERLITTATDDSIEALTARVTALINSVGRGDPAIVAPLT